MIMRWNNGNYWLSETLSKRAYFIWYTLYIGSAKIIAPLVFFVKKMLWATDRAIVLNRWIRISTKGQSCSISRCQSHKMVLGTLKKNLTCSFILMADALLFLFQEELKRSMNMVWNILLGAGSCLPFWDAEIIRHKKSKVSLRKI